MVRTILAAWVALMPATALAISCDEFERRVQNHDTEDLLRPFEIEAIPSLPGNVDVTNLPGIVLGMSCNGGEFQRLGATLTDDSPAGLTRWSIFIVSAMRAIKPDADRRNMAKLAADLQGKSNDDAKRREIREGFRIGSATEVVGDWEVRFQIDER